jgi:ATP-dependent RNA helicase DDX42
MAEVHDILGDRESVSSSQALDTPTILTQEGSVPCSNLSEIPSFSTSKVITNQPYSSHKQSTHLSPDQLSQLLKDYEIHTEGENIPDPVFSFSGFPFDKNLLDRIQKAGYEKPTPIQSIGVPCVLKSRDVLAISKTGTGKTAVYVWPMVSHIASSKPSKKDEGPVALVLVPTRELCIQVYNEAKKYCRLYGQKVVAIYGGVPKHEQWKELKGRCEAVVATPARLIDLLEKKATNLKRVTYLVLDEADEMFNMGFEYQCKSIISHCPRGRQTLLFSATFKPKIQHLAEESLRNPIKIVIGKTGQVTSNQSNLDIRQEILTFKDYSQKLPWLRNC